MDWMVQEQPDLVTDISDTLEKIKNSFTQTGLYNLEKNQNLQSLDRHFYKYRKDMKKHGTDMQKYWLSYLEKCAQSDLCQTSR